MAKRVREGSITIDDTQPSEVALQVGSRSFTIRIDHFVHDDYVCICLLTILSSILVLSLLLTMLLEAQINRVHPIVSHMR